MINVHVAIHVDIFGNFGTESGQAEAHQIFAELYLLTSSLWRQASPQPNG